MIGRKRHERAAKVVFEALDRAEPVLVGRLAAYGITGVEFVVGFVHPYSVSVWLVTASDAQRDALGGGQPLHDEVGAILTEAGLAARHAYFAGTTAQSQETVDRDYEGNWFYALR